MTWIILCALAIGGALVAFVARDLMTRVVIAACVAAGLGAYAWLGAPGMPDAPLSGRLAELEARASESAESMTGEEIMALLQKRASESPQDPNPHKFMGDLLASAGQADEAMMAYQSALRRDPAFQPALKAMADLSFKMSGTIDERTAALYKAAFQLDPSDLRIGYMAGIGDWNAGRREEALALWADIEARVAAEDPRAQMFRALKETFAPEALTPQ
jgi:cytochrome c-type biogenesis protein CcmH